MSKVDELANLISSMSSGPKTSPYDTTAEVVRVEGDTAWVHIPGGVDETPARLTMSVSEGDVVQIRVSGGRAWITGNASAPPTDDAEAIIAQKSAENAQNTADSAQESAENASIAASEARNAADQAIGYSEAAKASASNASEYASRALGNLSTVQNVAETLNWITKHGTMELTTDTELDPSHVYFVLDENGDYTVGNNRYSVVTEPDATKMPTYYELSINQSLNNYIATHLAVDEEGLWIIPEDNATISSSSKKMLIAVGGTDHTYKTAGTYIIEKVDGVDTVIALFTASGTQMGLVDEGRLFMDYHSIQLFGYDSSDPYFYISDLREKNDDWQATITETFTGDGETKDFDVGLPVSKEVSAVDSSHPSEIATRNNQRYTFTIAPDDGATITIVYKTKSPVAKAYTFGYRLPRSKIGPMSVAEGRKTTASGYISHAEGYESTASGIASHAEGYESTASGDYSHAEGFGFSGSGTVASGLASHAEGYGTTAKSGYSHAEGFGTTAGARGSHVEGIGSITSGIASHAQNTYTVTGYGSQTAIGKYNKNKFGTAFEIGNGSGDTEEERSNAFEVYWDGKVISSGAFHTENSSNGNAVELQVGYGGTNRGVYVPGVGWMIYYDGSNTRINNFAVDTATCTIARGWTNYTSGQGPLCRKQGDVVTFLWQCKPTSSKTINATRTTVCTIPEEYRPPRMVSTIQQGTATRVFEMSVQTNGEVQVARLRNMNSTSYDTADSSFWFPLYATWIVS